MAVPARFFSIGRTDRGCVRTVNQDTFFACDSAGLWAVSDGMGGHASGEVASAQVADQLRTVVRSEKWPIAKAAVEDALRRANDDLQERSSASGHRLGMGATAAVLCASDSRYFCLWVGDSRIYRLHDGRLTLLTHDHRYVQELVDGGVLGQVAARHHPMRNVLTRAIGLEPVLQIDAREGAFERDDVFLIATDGVTGVCTDDEIAAILNRSDLILAADELATKCNERGSPDNFTLVLVRASGAE